MRRTHVKAMHDGDQVYAVILNGPIIVYVEAHSPDAAWTLAQRLPSRALTETLTRGQVESAVLEEEVLADGAEAVWFAPTTCRYPGVPERLRHRLPQRAEDGAQ
jgi:hypothetical protein